jgi:hypothetical protein
MLALTSAVMLALTSAVMLALTGALSRLAASGNRA